MLTAYFDESGTDGNSPIVAVGGYVSTDSNWNDFQNEWRQFQADEQIAVFHTTDLLSQRGEFTEAKGWSRARVMQVLSRADEIIEKHSLFGVVAYTHIDECEKVIPLKDESGARKKYSAEYLFSGVMAVIGISRWASENGYTYPIKYIFEDGACGKGYLLDATTEAQRTAEGKEKFMIGGIDFKKKTDSLPLHSADKLIQQSCRAVAKYIRGSEVEQNVIDRLIKAKLRKVYRFDSENLPLLRQYFDARLVEIANVRSKV